MNHINSMKYSSIATAPARRWGRGIVFACMFVLSAVFMLGSTSLQAAEQATASVAAAVNINSADAETMASQLNGIGQTRAQEIVRYREAYGKFSSVEELAEVKGIEHSTLEKNRHLITLE